MNVVVLLLELGPEPARAWAGLTQSRMRREARQWAETACAVHGQKTRLARFLALCQFVLVGETLGVWESEVRVARRRDRDLGFLA
jgi:hypothetical protein